MTSKKEARYDNDVDHDNSNNIINILYIVNISTIYKSKIIVI